MIDAVMYPLILAHNFKTSKWVGLPNHPTQSNLIFTYNFLLPAWLPLRNTVELKKTMTEAMAKTLICNGACHMPMHRCMSM